MNEEIKIVADIICGTFVTLEMDGEIKCIELWDTVSCINKFGRHF